MAATPKQGIERPRTGLTLWRLCTDVATQRWYYLSEEETEESHSYSPRNTSWVS